MIQRRCDGDARILSMGSTFVARPSRHTTRLQFACPTVSGVAQCVEMGNSVLLDRRMGHGNAKTAANHGVALGIP